MVRLGQSLALHIGIDSLNSVLGINEALEILLHQHLQTLVARLDDLLQVLGSLEKLFKGSLPMDLPEEVSGMKIGRRNFQRPYPMTRGVGEGAVRLLPS